MWTRLGSPAVKVREEECRVPASDCEIRSVVISPVAEGPRPGILLYTDIFQLTESTLRTARRIAAAGFVVCVP
jgi:carboxymethylenebutenolidase